MGSGLEWIWALFAQLMVAFSLVIVAACSIAIVRRQRPVNAWSLPDGSAASGRQVDPFVPGLVAEPRTGGEATMLLARVSCSLRAQGWPGIPIGLVASIPAFLTPTTVWLRGRVGLGLVLLAVQYGIVIFGKRYGGYRQRVVAAIPAPPSASFETAHQTRRRVQRRYLLTNVASLLTLSVFGFVTRLPLGAGLVGFSAALLTGAAWLRRSENRHGILLWHRAATGELRLLNPGRQLYSTTARVSE